MGFFCSPRALFTWISTKTKALLKHDWSIILGLQTDTRTLLIPKPCPLPTDISLAPAEQV